MERVMLNKHFSLRNENFKNIAICIILSPIYCYLAFSFIGWFYLCLFGSVALIEAVLKFEITFAVKLLLIFAFGTMGWIGLLELIVIGGVGFKRYKIRFLLLGMLSITMIFKCFILNEAITEGRLLSELGRLDNAGFFLMFGGVQVLVATVGILWEVWINHKRGNRFFDLRI
jgi:hypothetical protein